MLPLSSDRLATRVYVHSVPLTTTRPTELRALTEESRLKEDPNYFTLDLSVLQVTLNGIYYGIVLDGN
jgi:hypothetical protein